MSEDRDRPLDHELLERLRTGYNPPPPTPAVEMWAAIRSSLPSEGAAGHATEQDVLSLDAARRERTSATARRERTSAAAHRPIGWAVAAAAVLALGMGIGRMTAPGAAGTDLRTVWTDAGVHGAVMHAAAVDHLGRSESLLTLVRAEGRDGSLDAQVGAWAQSLLTQTRLFLDTPGERDPGLVALMEDLELALAQIVGAAAVDPDEGRGGTELRLALEGLDERELMARLQAVSGPALAGT